MEVRIVCDLDEFERGSEGGIGDKSAIFRLSGLGFGEF